MQTLPECHFVFLTSPPLSLSEPKFLCILHRRPPHFDAPVLPLFVFISPSSSSLSFLPSFPPSIHLFSSSGGEALRLAVRSPLPPTILCEGESYWSLWTGFCTSLGRCVLSLSCACLRAWTAFPPGLTKSPALSQKAPVHHWWRATEERKHPWENLW